MQRRDQTGKGDTGRRVASLLNDHAWAEIARTLGITRRELQIVQGVFDNLPKAGIAGRLHIPEHTVHTHLNRLFKKLEVTTRADLVLRIMEQLITLTLSETSSLSPICRHYSGGCCLHNAHTTQPTKS